MTGRSPQRPALLAALNQAMRRFTNHVTFFSEAVASRLGLHPTDLDCLSAIELDGPLTAGRLAEVTGLTTGAVTGVIDRLERAGHVRREPDPNDRRRVLVRVVPGSLRPIGEAFEPMQRATEQMCDRYSDDELALITDYATRAVPMLREETLRIRDSGGANGTDTDESGDAVLVGGTGVQAATLRILHGAARLVVTAKPEQPQLFAAQWWGARPTTKQDGDTVTVQYRRSPFGHFRTRGAITLDAGAVWRLEVTGGTAHSTFDLREADVGHVDFSGGLSSVEVHLPRPSGQIAVQINGGVHAMTITRPAGVPARVVVNGGASNLVLDEQRFGGIGGRTQLHSEAYEDSGPRVDVTVRGGSSSLSVVTRPPT